MAKDDVYRQCMLVLTSNDGSLRFVDICWIPTDKAKVGRVLRIDDVDGWVVRATYAARSFEDLEGERYMQKHLEENLKDHC